jgi:hypothetical protein
MKKEQKRVKYASKRIRDGDSRTTVMENDTRTG